jgi:AcrR family transcriptional regulator
LARKGFQMLTEIALGSLRNIMSPKINARTTSEQREWRREQLLSVALELALESPSHEISMSTLAKRAGLSRTSVYEYFSSSSDVITHVLIQELEEYERILTAAIESTEKVTERVRAWIEASLHYVTSGDHLLARGMGSITTNQATVALFRSKHQALLAPLAQVFTELGVTDTHRALVYTQAVVEIAAKNIERIDQNRTDKSEAAEREIEIAVDLVLTALAALQRA